MPGLQFGVNVRFPSSGRALERLVRRADELDFDVLAAPDHLGSLAPFSILAAAGTISGRLRLRTYVLNVGFWNTALLARETATLDLLSDGRVELGLGAGHVKAEHVSAGLPWPSFERRVQAMEAAVVDVRRRLADESCRPHPVQQPVPMMVGAMSRAGLAVAASHADIVGFAGTRQIKGAPAGTLTVSTAAETAARVAEVRRLAGARPYRSDALLQMVAVDRDPEDAAAEIASHVPGLTAAGVLDSPFVLLAPDAHQAAEELRRRQSVYGFDSVTTHEPSLEALGQVIAAYRASAPTS